jgi:hypothetical protein
MIEGIQSSSLLDQRINNANYDESNVGDFELPDPLICDDGTIVTDPQLWISKRRKEIVQQFANNVYGNTPEREYKISFETLVSDPEALDGKATRKEIAIYLLGDINGPRIDLQLFIPNDAKGPVPAILGCNFFGNHAVVSDPKITLSTKWMRNTPDGKNVVNHLATQSSRGSEAHRWEVEKIVASGFALATFYYGDIEPDHVDGWKNGIRAALATDGAQTEFAPSDWGAVSAWAWGLSRAMDYLEQDEAINSKNVAVMGHSRLGKAALWAGAQDERFALVISNNSGAGGTSLARRNFGESVTDLNSVFPYWFCKKYSSFSLHPEELPVDMHELVALIAPRPLYIASAQEDKWADPKGEFLSGKYAQAVYSLFNKVGVGVEEWPDVNTPVGDFIGYHVRTGKHDVTAYDWHQYLSFATRHFRNS